jgi:hypothetical protein
LRILFIPPEDGTRDQQQANEVAHNQNVSQAKSDLDAALAELGKIFAVEVKKTGAS